MTDTTILIVEKPCVVCSTGHYPSFSLGRDLCEKHNVCIYCGIKRAELDHVPWGSLKGAFICSPCERRRRDADIRERIAKGFEHEYTDDVVCPHCGYVHGDSFEISDGEHNCPDCEKAFIVERDVSVTYSTEKKQRTEGTDNA